MRKGSSEVCPGVTGIYSLFILLEFELIWFVGGLYFKLVLCFVVLKMQRLAHHPSGSWLEVYSDRVSMNEHSQSSTVEAECFVLSSHPYTHRQPRTDSLDSKSDLPKVSRLVRCGMLGAQSHVGVSSHLPSLCQTSSAGASAQLPLLQTQLFPWRLKGVNHFCTHAFIIF